MMNEVNLLQSNTQLSLLNTIDELRAKGVDHYISLPQLIVCGDQSSGKSSVLHALSGVEFPKSEHYCTQFSTEIILRRAATPAAVAELRPRPSATNTKLPKSGKRIGGERSASLSDVPKLIEEASKVIGQDKKESRACDYILTLRLSGPDMPYLTLIDLPGLIHTQNRGQTYDDVLGIKALVEEYMAQPECIILAIVSAQNYKENQIVIRLAKEYDPTGSRTLGIITKPDTLETGSDREATYIELARNRDVVFLHGWHVLRNANAIERKDESFNRRVVESTFFNRGKWDSLSKQTVGVKSLQYRLREILLNRIKLELPKVTRRVQLEIRRCHSRLEKFGNPRNSPKDQMNFLTELSVKFQVLCRDAIHGYYTHDFFSDDREDSTRRLRAIIFNMSEEFANKMYERGHTYEIVDGKTEITQTSPQQIHRADYMMKIQGYLQQYRGRELQGNFNPAVIDHAFKQNSRSWGRIARDYVREVCEIMETFLDDLLDAITEPDMAHRLSRGLFYPALERKLRLVNEKVTELLEPFKTGHPATLNRQFIANLRELQSREKGMPTGKERQSETLDYDACSQILDCMTAYYGIALNVFIDNVASLAVENCLLKDLPELFSPSIVSDLSLEQLQELCQETDAVRDARQEEEEKLRVLEAGLWECKKHARYNALASQQPVSEASLIQFRLTGASLKSKDPVPTALSYSSTPTGDVESRPASASKIDDGDDWQRIQSGKSTDNGRGSQLLISPSITSVT
ncbi:vacuolar sorting protein [Talaromyces proteolyticus]|uniref:Vacuolar sorting protein n=1 Tax=Talaromyces proteolyticus TaxID=1131652 RepID=A0AAD4L0M6_9EURO|nr:vacuolar sorting protein [Talaromyces proteolyticus]KAH8700709.1 vacuolar sorting protein [Talaromyces proteolyticus]